VPQWLQARAAAPAGSPHEYTTLQPLALAFAAMCLISIWPQRYGRLVLDFERGQYPHPGQANTDVPSGAAHAALRSVR
jgi:hypothetical protein